MSEPISQLEHISAWMAERISDAVPEGVIVINEWQDDIAKRVTTGTARLTCGVQVFRPRLRYRPDADMFELSVQVEVHAATTSTFNTFAVAEAIGIALHGLRIPNREESPEAPAPSFYQLCLKWSSIEDVNKTVTILTFESTTHIETPNTK